MFRVQIARGVCGCTPPKKIEIFTLLPRFLERGEGIPRVPTTHETPKKNKSRQTRKGGGYKSEGGEDVEIGLHIFTFLPLCTLCTFWHAIPKSFSILNHSLFLHFFG